MKKTIKVGQYGIDYIGDEFKEHFGDIEVSPKKCNLSFKTLERKMGDGEIFREFKPQEISLDELVYALENESNLLKNTYSNISYIRDNEGVLWAVYCHWGDGGWSVGADSVGSPYEWGGGSHVLSRNSFGTHNESLNINHFDLSELEITYKGDTYKIVKNK